MSNQAFNYLEKRVHFVGSNVFKAKRVISDATLTVTAIADPGLIEDGSAFIVDHGDSYRFMLSLSDSEGPIAGVPLLAPKRTLNGLEYGANLPTDAQGQLELYADTGKTGFVPGLVPLPIDLGPFSRTLDMKIRVLIETEVQLRYPEPEEVRVTAHYTRRDERLFPVGWSEVFTFKIGFAIFPWRREIKPEGFMCDGLLDATKGTSVRLGIGDPPDASVFRLIGQTEFPLDN